MKAELAFVIWLSVMSACYADAATVEVPPRYHFTSTQNSKVKTTELEIGIINELTEPAEHRTFYTMTVLVKDDPSLKGLSDTSRLSKLKAAISALAPEARLKNSGLHNATPFVLFEAPKRVLWAARESAQKILIFKVETRQTDKAKAQADLTQLLRETVFSP